MPRPTSRGAHQEKATSRRLYRRVVLVSLVLCIGLALLMNGSVVAPYRQIAFVLLTAVLALGVWVRLTQRDSRRLAGWTLGCLGLFVLWSGVQILPIPAGWPAHPVWAELSQLGLDAGAHISIVPAQTLASLPAAILPVLVFVAFVVLCQERREAIFAWTLLAALGVGLAALAVVLELFFPDVRFFSTAPVGSGAFNGFLRNRNTTAAFLGLAAFALGALLLLPKSDQGRTRRSADIARGPVDPARFVMGAVLFLLVITLILTRSRAGAALALMALALAFVLFFVLQPTKAARGTRHLRPLHKAALAALTISAVFVAFGEPVLSRFAMQRDDARWCAFIATWQAIQARPLTGTGFGTFAEMFPRYRDPECLGTSGTWVRAHNSYLEFVAGSGAIGAVVLAVALARVGQVLFSGIRTRRSLRAIPVFTAGAAMFVMLHSMVDFPLQIPGIALYFAALLGTGCAVSVLSRSGERRSAKARRGAVLHGHSPRDASVTIQ